MPTTAASTRKPSRSKRTATAAPVARQPAATADRPRGAARRIALLEATLSLVAELGTDGVTHRAVAARADLPLASTTYWFASKDELLTEALRHAADRDTERLRTSARLTLAEHAADTGGSGDTGRGRALTPADIVAVVFETAACTDPAADRAALLAAYSLILEAARRPALRSITEGWTRAYLETVGELLTRAGSQRPVDDARLVMAATDGLLIDRLATGAAAPSDPRAELERLITGLL